MEERGHLQEQKTNLKSCVWKAQESDAPQFNNLEFLQTD